MHAAKSEDLHGNKAHYEVRRQYHCMAYNMVMAIIPCTQQQPQFYAVFLFKEDPTKVSGIYIKFILVMLFN